MSVETSQPRCAPAVCLSLPVLGVVCPDSSANGGPNDNQKLPQPYWGENGPVTPLDDSIQP